MAGVPLPSSDPDGPLERTGSATTENNRDLWLNVTIYFQMIAGQRYNHMCIILVYFTISIIIYLTISRYN